MYDNKHHHSMQRDRSGFGVLPFLAGVIVTMVVGGYYFFGSRGRENHKKVDRWMRRARYEILDRMQDVGEMTEDQYHKIVDEVMDRYGYLRDMGSEKLAEASKEWKARWREMKDATAKAREEAEREVLNDEHVRGRGSKSRSIGGDAPRPDTGTGPDDSTQRGFDYKENQAPSITNDTDIPSPRTNPGNDEEDGSRTP